VATAVNVGELEDLLAMLPKDMPVHIVTGGSCCHVDQVEKHNRRRIDPECSAAMQMIEFPDQHAPAALVLRGRTPWWRAWADDVPYEVTGRWPAWPRR
jgi:hypothetical protein